MITIRFKEQKKQVVVVYDVNKMVNPVTNNFYYPIPTEIVNQIVLSGFIEDLDKRIDTRSRKQALIVS